MLPAFFSFNSFQTDWQWTQIILARHGMNVKAPLCSNKKRKWPFPGDHCLGLLGATYCGSSNCILTNVTLLTWFSSIWGKITIVPSNVWAVKMLRIECSGSGHCSSHCYFWLSKASVPARCALQAWIWVITMMSHVDLEFTQNFHDF